MTAKQQYLQEFGIMSDAGVAVILTRTSEPGRVVRSLREFALQWKLPFRRWNLATGLVEIGADGRPKKVGTPDPIATTKMIGDIDGDGTKALEGITVMEGLHPFLKRDEPNPLMVQLIRQYAFDFPAASAVQRLVLVMPEGYQMPDELAHDLPVLDYELPDKTELEDIFLATLAPAYATDTSDGKDAAARQFTETQRATLIANAAGMTALEAETAFSEAIMRNRECLAKLPFSKFNQCILDAKTQVIKRGDILELMPVGDMSQVGGLDQLKSWMQRRKPLYSEEARAFGAETPKGVALIGPPGTGKSLAAKAIAAELDQPLIRFDVGKVFGSLVGQSEARIRAALKQLQAMAPCVAFIDEVDKAGLDPRNGSGDSGTSQRVMGSILTFMQESKAPIFWLFTANRVKGLPPEMLRKGRLDEVFSVLPPNRSERRAVIAIHLAKRNHSIDELDSIEDVLDASDGYVSAEIEAAVKEAVIEAYCSKKPVTASSILSQLRAMKPMSVAFPDDFREMQEWASNNARPSSSPEAMVLGEEAPARPRRRLR